MAKTKTRSTRKSTPSYTHDAMSRAIAEVKSGSSIRNAAKMHGVPRSSLSDRITGKVEHGAIWGKQPILSKEDEAILVETAEQRAEQGVGLTKRTVLKYASLLAEKRSKGFKKSRPSQMWWRRLKTRNPSFSLRTPEATSSGRHQAMTRLRIAKYFSALKGVMEKADLLNKPARIWNMDETGINMTHKPGKVLAKRGSKAIHGKSSDSREMITVIACGNAEGRVIPAHLIIPGKTEKKLHGYDLESIDSQSPLKGANFSVSDSGWTKDGIGKLWFTQTFLPSIGPERPQLLVCDGHNSHNNVEFLTLARDDNIIIVELPSKTSNWTQPFDRTVFKPLKNAWNNQVDDFTHATGVTVSHGQFLRIFGRAWANALTPANVKAGFKATGIYPFDPSAIPDEAYKPSELFSAPSNEKVGLKHHPETAPSLGTQVDASDVSSGGTSNSIDESLEEPTDATTASAADDTVLSELSFSIPVQYDEPLEPYLDLPVVVKNNMLILDEEVQVNEAGTSAPDPQETRPDSASAVNISECPDSKALEIVESVLTPQKLLSYTAALVSGKDIKNDSLFSTWKLYKSRLLGTSQIDNVMEPLGASQSLTAKSIFPKIEPPAPKKNTKLKKQQNFFVITSDEAYQRKLHAANEKEKKNEEKKKKQAEREKKQALLREKKLLVEQIKKERIKRKLSKQLKPKTNN